MNNALQRIIVQCEQAALRRTAAGAALADDVRRRIILSAQISDTLFGMIAELAPFEDRLGWLVEATIGLLGDDTQTIRSEIEVTGRCPEPLIPVVLQVVHEMVGNAVLHGMHMRLLDHFQPAHQAKNGLCLIGPATSSQCPGSSPNASQRRVVHLVVDR